MALRARADNMAVEHPATAVESGAPAVDFEELWAFHGDVRALCRRIVGDDGTADDILQDTFLRALVNARQLDRRVSFAPWLVTVARRRSIDRLRSDGRAQPMAVVPDGMASSVDGDPVEHVLQQERVRRVREALATLRPRERRLLMRQIAHGLSMSELAAEEDTSIGSVRSVLSRARTKLRAELERGGPLGVAPAPGLVAAVKRRFHRLAVRLEGSMPMLAGGGAQFGDVVMAVVAAVAMLIAGNVPPTEAPSQFLTALAGAEQPSPTAAPHTGSAEPTPLNAVVASNPASAFTAATTTTATTALPPPWSPLATPDVVDVPAIPDSRASQPDDAIIDGFATSDSGVVFAHGQGTNASWVYRSDDGGHSWQRMRSVGYTGGPLLVPAGYPTTQTIFAVQRGTGLLLRSDDGGNEFSPTTARGAATLFPGSPLSPADVLLAMPQLMRYHTGDRTTTPVGIGPTEGASSVAVPLDYATNGAVLVGSSSKTSFPAQDTGVVHRCTQLACTRTVLTGSSNAPSLHVSASEPGVVLAHKYGRLHRSTDHGATFSPVTLPAGVRIEDVADGDVGELLLASIGTSGTGAGLYRSTDGGQTWSAMTTDTLLDQGAFAVIRLSTGEIVAGVSGGNRGLYCSADDGATWATRCP